MGDTATNQDEVTKQEPNPQSLPDDTNPIDSKPCEIIVSSKSLDNSEEKLEKVHDRISGESLPKPEPVLETTPDSCPKPSNEKIRTKPDVKKPEEERKPLIDSLEPVTSNSPLIQEDGLQPKDRFLSKSSPVTPNTEKKCRVGSAASGLIERVNRNQSDIFSLKEETSIASSIFSVNGSPSRKVFRRRELIASNVFPFGQKEEPPSEKVPVVKEKVRDTKESYNELRRPSSSLRNPLTGTGLSSNDEYKFKGSKRKDGNPLLGLGYSPEATPSSHRIPPGGYSHKLW